MGLTPHVTNIQLNGRFDVTGWFYVGPGQTECRSYLNIRANSGRVPNEPDLMVVMMNPGGSVPLTGGNNGQAEVPAEPDNTQYYIMRVMVAKGFRFARVLNLSDYRHRSSNQFYPQIRILDSVYPEHSIFHANRVNDFDGLFNHSVQLVLGWGTDNRLKHLAEMALNRIEPGQIAGISYPTKPWAYRHPLICKDWRGQIVNQL